LAMHEKLAPPAVDLMLLDLAGVVRHVVEKIELRGGEQRLERIAREMREYLPVGERAVDRGAHGAQVALSDRRAGPRAGELAIAERNARVLRGDRHLAQEIGADLVAQPARAAVDADHDRVDFEAEASRGVRVVDLGDALHFEIMIAGAERAHLVALALLRRFGNRSGIGPRHRAVLLDALEVLGPPVAD